LARPRAMPAITALGRAFAARPNSKEGKAFARRWPFGGQDASGTWLRRGRHDFVHPSIAAADDNELTRSFNGSGQGSWLPRERSSPAVPFQFRVAKNVPRLVSCGVRRPRPRWMTINTASRTSETCGRTGFLQDRILTQSDTIQFRGRDTHGIPTSFSSLCRPKLVKGHADVPSRSKSCATTSARQYL